MTRNWIPVFVETVNKKSSDHETEILWRKQIARTFASSQAVSAIPAIVDSSSPQTTTPLSLDGLQVLLGLLASNSIYKINFLQRGEPMRIAKSKEKKG